MGRPVPQADAEAHLLEAARPPVDRAIAPDHLGADGKLEGWHVSIPYEDVPTRPPLRPQQDAVPHPLDIDVVDPEVGAVEALPELGQRGRLDRLVDLHDIEHRLAAI